MEQKIFLESNRSKSSVNEPNVMGIDLENSTRAMEGSGLLGDFSLFEQYNVERDNCDKYRLILVVNPICSNVLFNMQTEVVQKEGSDEAISLIDNYGINPTTINREDGTPASGSIINTSMVTREQAIRDTEYSHPDNGGFVYHCGTDIFNNHMLRGSGFVHVNPLNALSKSECSTVFNTIFDYLRDSDGNIVRNYVSPYYGMSSGPQPLHLYRSDSIQRVRRAYLDRIKEKDGWIGFTNPGYIDIPNTNNKDNADVRLNKMLANNKACEFIDMYPDRSLFSFIPKYNKYRKRAEKNWDYCLTYPYAKDYEKINTVFGGVNGAIKAKFVESVNSSGALTLTCYSLFRHTLRPNSQIAIYVNGNRFPVNIRVLSVGDSEGKDDGHTFTIRQSDVSKIYGEMSDGFFFYKKVVSGNECEYYFRKYKKLKINGKEPASELTKMSYAENIYGDREAQIVFTDTIDTSNLYDHMGRPLSEVYFTVIKRNAGYKQWYDNANFGDETVEFSHCFGEVTSGVDFGDDTDLNLDYNIRYLHNIGLESSTLYSLSNARYSVLSGSYETVKDMLGDVFKNGIKPKALENDITIDNDDFYGDVVEFDPYNYVETEISPVLHRVNTAQRETQASPYLTNGIKYDDIEKDDFDYESDTAVGSSGVFVARRNEQYCKIKKGDDIFTVPGNLRPEGYFYNPHTRIVLKGNGDVKRSRSKYINFTLRECEYADNNRTVVVITVPTMYNFLKNDFIGFYGDSGTAIWGNITGIDGRDITLNFDGYPFGSFRQDVEDNIVKYKAYYSTDSVPSYASFNKGTREFAWRGFIMPSEMSKDDELYDRPFSNGHFYIEKNITFFLRRQDPTGVFGLSYARHDDDEKHSLNPMEYFNIDSTYLDLSQVYNFYNKLDNICY